MAPHRRHGQTGCGRLLLPGRPEEGRHHLRRREPLSRSDRGLPLRLSQGPRRGRHRPARQAPGRDRRGHYPGKGRHDLHRERDQPVLHRSAPVQAAPEDHLRRRAPQPHRQDRKAQAAGEVLRRPPRRGPEPGLTYFFREKSRQKSTLRSSASPLQFKKRVSGLGLSLSKSCTVFIRKAGKKAFCETLFRSCGSRG